MIRNLLTLCLLSSVAAMAEESKCGGLPTDRELRNWMTQLQHAPSILGAENPMGGLFNGARVWIAVVNRDGELCVITTSTTDPKQVWPGSQAVAKSKAFTANAFSVDSLPLSTARLYTLTQPGHSLAGLGAANPFQPAAAIGEATGGMIFFGGGVPIYNAQGKVIGGLGVSGDTACTDHEVAKRLRHFAGLNPPAGPLADDITYAVADGSTPYTHPLCINTWRNGVQLGNEKLPSGY